MTSTKKAVPEVVVSEELLASSGGLLSALLAELNLVSSRDEARRLILGGGVRVEGKQVLTSNYVWDGTDGDLIRYGRKLVVLRRLNETVAVAHLADGFLMPSERFRVWVWRVSMDKASAAEDVTRQEAHEIRLALYHNPTTLKVAIEPM
jgi:ribosomal protein S4